jgi:hypothetical protein
MNGRKAKRPQLSVAQPDGTEVNLYDLLYDLFPSIDGDKYEIRVQDDGVWIFERDLNDDDGRAK